MKYDKMVAITQAESQRKMNIAKNTKKFQVNMFVLIGKIQLENLETKKSYLKVHKV